jgi:hypothetical protein
MDILGDYWKCSNCGDIMSNSYGTCDKCGYPVLNSQPFPKFIERICGNCEERIDASHASTSVEELDHTGEYINGIWALVEIDISKLAVKVKRINITMPENVIISADSFAKKPSYQSFRTSNPSCHQIY